MGFSFLQTEICKSTYNLRFLVPTKWQTASQTYRRILLNIKLTLGWIWPVTVKGHGVILSFICRFQITFLTSSSSLCYNGWCLRVPYKSAWCLVRVPVPPSNSKFLCLRGPRIPVLINSYKGESGTNWESSINTDTVPCVKQTAGGKTLSGAGSSARCSVMPSTGRHGWEVQGRGDIRILTAGSRCWTAETDTVRLSNYPPV